MIRVSTQAQTGTQQQALTYSHPEGVREARSRRIYGTEVSEAIREAISQHMRSGALDGPEQEVTAIQALAAEFRLTIGQAWSQWLGYAATAQPQ